MTERCLVDDFGVPSDDVAELVKQDAREFQGLHKAIKKFVSMRGADPAGAEPIYGPFKRGLIGSLHVGQARAVTTWDADENVCWLLAYNEYHRNGDPDDAYEVFLGLYAVDKLLPSADDYGYFFASDEDTFFDRLLAESRDLLARARGNPGVEEMMTWHDHGRQVMCVDVVVEDSGSAEEGWMGLTLPENENLTDDEVFELVQTLVPPGVTPIYCRKFRDRDRRRGEIVYRWEHYDDGGGA